MNLFILLLVLAVRRLDIGWTKSWVADNRIERRLLPVVSWAQRNNKGNGVVWLLAVVLPVVLWAWLRASVPWALAVVLDALLLLWLLGAESEFRYVTGLVQRLRMRDGEQFQAQAEQHFGMTPGTEDEAYVQGLCARILMKSAEGTFAVLFWFFLLGTLGSLAFALNFALARTLKAGNVAEQWHRFLVWLPQRLLLVAMALAGSFRGVVEGTARHWWQLDGEALLRSVVPEGLDLPRNMPNTFLERAKVQLLALEGLLNRCLALWLIIGVLWWALFY